MYDIDIYISRHPPGQCTCARDTDSCLCPDVVRQTVCASSYCPQQPSSSSQSQTHSDPEMTNDYEIVKAQPNRFEYTARDFRNLLWLPKRYIKVVSFSDRFQQEQLNKDNFKQDISIKLHTTHSRNNYHRPCNMVQNS